MVDEDTGIWSYADATTPWSGDGRGHGSCQSLKPLLAKYFDTNHPLIDMGCGLGDYIQYLSEQGFEVYGFDGTPSINETSIYHPVLEADLTKPVREQLDLPQGNVMSLEVGEHIPPVHEEMFLKNITDYCSNTLILSWALPNQGGHGHYNEQSNDYVINKLTNYGLIFDSYATQRFREELMQLIEKTSVDHGWVFFTRTIMIFRRD